MLLSLDIETKCAVKDCDDKECRHALDAYRNIITVVGTYCRDDGFRSFRDLGLLDDYLSALDYPKLVGHNLKFDLHTLLVKGLDLRDCYEHDTQVMAAVQLKKIPEVWLLNYEKRRVIESAKLPVGVTHRQAGHLSLKCLAPYFLDVPAFWENPADHDDDVYLEKDCRYTYELYYMFRANLIDQGFFRFYSDWFLPKARMLLDMEVWGIDLDLDELSRQEVKTSLSRSMLKDKVDGHWSRAYDFYLQKGQMELMDHYDEKVKIALNRLVYPKIKNKALAKQRFKEKQSKCRLRYNNLYIEAVERLEEFSLDSPKQLAWLLRDYLGLDIVDYYGEESTGKAVLQTLSNKGREDVKIYIDYRKANKLYTSFFPRYRALHVDSVIHCNFNPTGTRTGRISASSPNMQQVPAHLHDLFVARKGYELATFDQSGIEAKLIAYFTEDPELNRILNSGKNFHSYNTKFFMKFPEPLEEIKEKYPLYREAFKNSIFTIFYGGSWRRLHYNFMVKGIPQPEKKCREIHRKIKQMYKGIWEYKDILDAQLKTGVVMKNLFGRPVYFSNPDDVHMKGFNTLIQGSASDLVLDAAQRIQDSGLKPLLLIHDEIITEVSKDEDSEIIKNCMTDYQLKNCYGDVKLQVEGNVGRQWKK